jgi:hypothetical protein
MRSFAAVLAFVLLLAASPAARAADPVHIPDAGGWTFDTDVEAWKNVADDCLLLNGIPDPTAMLCEMTNSYDAAEGVPKGSLRSAMYTLVNTSGLFAAQGTWTSPSFTVPAGTKVGVVTAFLDRRAVLTDFFAEQGIAVRSDMVIVDETAENARILALRDDLGAADAANWIRRTRALGADSLTPGHAYHIDLVTNVSSATARVIDGDVGANYDNVRLTIAEPEKGDPGTPGSAGAPGVPGPPGQPGSIGPASGGGPGTAQTLDGKDGVVNSEAARRLLEIVDIKKLQLTGGYANQLRTRIRCRDAVAQRCEGTVKVRTASPVSVRGKGGKVSKRHITFGSGAYQLARVKTGYAKALLTPAYKKFLQKRKSLKVEVIVTVLDEKGFQQTLQKKLTLRVAKKAKKRTKTKKR